jgi:hypothetical protein
MAKRLSTDIILNDDASVVFIPNAKAITTLGSKPKENPSSPVKTDFNTTEYEPWGLNNDYPQEVLDKVNKNSIIPSTLMWKANQMSSGGIRYGHIRGYNKDGTEIFEPADIPAVEDWQEENAPELYLEETLRDLFWWGNAFADFYLDEKRKQISCMINQEAIHGRFSRQNKRTGRKDWVYLSGMWPNANAENWKKVSCLDPYFAVQDQMKFGTKMRYMYPMSFSSPGDTYMQRASWHSIIDSLWLDIAEKIPEFKKALMDNQMHIKYVIHVPESWWKWKYKTWDKMTDAAKKAVQIEELRNFNKVLTGVKNVGKTLMLTFKHDAYGKQYTKWEVVPLQDKIQSGAYIEDSQECSSHILYSLLVDGTLIGNSPGKGMGAGSGSDKLRANNIFVINNKVYLDKALKPFSVVSKYNNWTGKKKEKIVWRGQSYLLATLDSGKEVKPEGKAPDKKKPEEDAN